MHLKTNSNLLRLDSDESSYISYNSRGLPTSMTPPDPDGAGALTSPVTTLAYDCYGRLTTLTNPDSSTQTFTYNTADQMLTHVDELGKTTLRHFWCDIGYFWGCAFFRISIPEIRRIRTDLRQSNQIG